MKTYVHLCEYLDMYKYKKYSRARHAGGGVNEGNMLWYHRDAD